MKFQFQLPTFTMLFLGTSWMTPNTLATLRGAIVANEASSPVPSSAPSLSPTTDTCQIQLDVDCTSPDGVPCHSIPSYTPLCTDRPTEMTLRYNGGDCSGSYNLQSGDAFQCSDFQDGPPTQDGLASYIKVFDDRGQTVYHSGFVNVGEDFILLDGGQKLGARMNVAIYHSLTGEEAEEDIVKPENILQTVTFLSSCVHNLYLKDRFGSVQLVGFVNDDQGTVTSKQEVTLGFNIGVPADIDGGNATLTNLSVLSNIENDNNGILNLNDEVVGKVVEPTMPLYVTEKVEIDLSKQQMYTVLSTVVGQTVEGEPCYGSDFLTFTV